VPARFVSLVWIFKVFDGSRLRLDCRSSTVVCGAQPVTEKERDQQPAKDQRVNEPLKHGVRSRADW